MRYKKTPLFSALITAQVITFPQVFAQDDLFTIDEIVVTAQKRAQSAQDIPVAVNAFNAEFVSDAGINNATDLIAYAPGFSGEQYTAGTTVYNVRGIGTDVFGIGAETSVGVFVDDLYAGRIVSSGLSFYDIERVEVVKGPQGTLFGRNTSAGAISVITNKPSNETEASIGVAAGNEGQRQYDLMGNLAINDNLAIRAAYQRQERDGFYNNSVGDEGPGDQDSKAGRLSARYNWSDRVESLLSYEYMSYDSGLIRVSLSDLDPSSATFFGPIDIRQVYKDNQTGRRESPEQLDAQRVNLQTTWDINDSLTLTSVTGYYTHDYMLSQEVQGSPVLVADYTADEITEQYSQEFRLNVATDAMDWFVGASFFNEQISSDQILDYDDFFLGDIYLGFLDTDGSGSFCNDGVDDLDGSGVAGDSSVDFDAAILCQSFVSETTSVTGETDSFALYGDAAFDLSESLKLTLGLRYSRDEKSLAYDAPVAPTGGLIQDLLGVNLLSATSAGEVKNSESWDNVSGRIAIDYQLNEDIMAYASVAQGYKAGGFNYVAGADGLPAEFDPEENLAYEIGVKSTLWNQRLQLNAAFFFNDYEKLQQNNIVGGLLTIVNSDASETSGFELDLHARPLQGLDIWATYAYIDASFSDDFIVDTDGDGLTENLKDNKLTRTPRNSGSVIAQYAIPVGDMGEVILRGEYLYKGEQYFDIANNLSESEYELYNARIAFESADGNWDLALVGENLTNREYIMDSQNPLALGAYAVRGNPRYYRVEGKLRF